MCVYLTTSDLWKEVVLKSSSKKQSTAAAESTTSWAPRRASITLQDVCQTVFCSTSLEEILKGKVIPATVSKEKTTAEKNKSWKHIGCVQLATHRKPKHYQLRFLGHCALPRYDYQLPMYWIITLKMLMVFSVHFIFFLPGSCKIKLFYSTNKNKTQQTVLLLTSIDTSELTFFLVFSIPF